MKFYPKIKQEEITIKFTASNAVIYIKNLNNAKITLNDTARLIFNCCNGLDNIEDIVLAIKNVYGDEPNIDKDVIETIKIFDEYGIINWRNNDTPFVHRIEINDFIVEQVDLNDLDAIYWEYDKCIKDGIYKKYNVSIDKTSLFQIMFFGIQKIFSIKRHDKSVALITFQKMEVSNVWQIIDFRYNDTIELFEFRDIFSVLMSDLINSNENNEAAITINTNKEDLNLFLEIGFSIEGVLKNEIEDEVYSVWMKGWEFDG